MRNAIGIATIVVLMSGCDGKKLANSGIQTVQAGVVQELQPTEPERFSAVVLPNLQVDLAFKSAGLIAQIHQVKGADGRWRDVEVGDKVADGTVLATVRALDYEQRIELGQAGVKQALAQWEEAKAGLGDADLDYTRAKNLYHSASLTKPDFDRAQAHYDSSQAQLTAAQAVVDSARTQLDQAKVALADTVLRTPFTGYVVACNVSKGSLVGNATVGFSLIDTHVVKADFAVPDTALPQVQLGQKLAMNLDALPNAATGTITAIAPQADAKSRVFSVELTIANASGTIRPGMIGSVSLSGAAHPLSRLVIPLSAVVRAPGNQESFAVYRIAARGDKSYAVAQTVQIGDTYGNAIEVTSGLAKGDRIVALGGELLQNEQQIRVLQ